MSIKLDKRLRAVVNEIDCDCLADVGCDHGKVAVASILEKRAKSVIACDISFDSLQKAVDLAKRYSLDNIQFRCGNGLEVVNIGEVDCVVIAGMGGLEIMSILARGNKKASKFVLVAHRNTIELRAFLAENGYYIDKDYVVEENSKFYDIIVAIADSQKDTKLTPKQLYLGKNSPQNTDYVQYTLQLKQKYQSLKEFSDKSPKIAQLEKIMEYI